MSNLEEDMQRLEEWADYRAVRNLEGRYSKVYSKLVPKLPPELQPPISVSNAVLRLADIPEDCEQITHQQRLAYFKLIRDGLSDPSRKNHKAIAAELEQIPEKNLGYKQLLSSADRVFGAFHFLPKIEREIILYQALQMIDGFSEERFRNIPDTETFLEYCGCAGGLVGNILTDLFKNKGYLDHLSDDEKVRMRSLGYSTGIAFQIANITKDIVKDYRDGRVFVPNDMLRQNSLSAQSLAETNPNNPEELDRAMCVRNHLELLFRPHWEEGIKYLDNLQNKKIKRFVGDGLAYYTSTMHATREPRLFLSPEDRKISAWSIFRIDRAVKHIADEGKSLTPLMYYLMNHEIRGYRQAYKKNEIPGKML